MDVNEKIKIFLNEIDQIKQITVENKPIRISAFDLFQKGIDDDFVHAYLKKLDYEFGIVTIRNLGESNIAIYNDNPDQGYNVFDLKEGFGEYYLKKTQISEISNKNLKLQDNPKSYNLKITYSETNREIILNNLFLIAKPDFDSENEQVFFYLYRNPNTLIKRGEVMENLNTTLTKDFGKIIENLNFKKDLRKAFFDVSRDSIKFYNPVSKERLDELGIKNIAIKVK